MRIFVRIAAAAAVLSPLFAQYGGPALLTRGQAPTGMSASQIDFRPFVSLDFGYDTGLNGVSVDTNGNATNVSSAAVDVTAGVSGLHSWKHTTLGLDYRISGRHNTANSFYDGFSQSLLLGITHRITRHVTFSLRQSAGLTSGNFAAPGLQQTIPFDPGTTYVPTNDFFDNRTMFVSTQADLQVQRSTRFSFDIGADGFLTRRRSTALYGNTGAGARGDVQYRLSRRSTIGAGYTYTHYSFTGIFSSTDLHSVVGTYAVTLARTVEVSAFAGVTFYETKFVRVVPIDPAIAAIIGVGTGRQVAYNLSHIPTFTGRISKVIPRGVVFLSVARSVTPGNGLFLTSTANAANAGYSYTGLKRWGISANASYTQSQSFGNFVGDYSGLAISTNVSRQVFRSTQGIIGFNARRYGSGDFKNYNKWSYGIRVGLGFTPGDIPIRLW